MGAVPVAGVAAETNAPDGTEWASAAPAAPSPSPVHAPGSGLITAVPGSSVPRAVTVAIRLDTGETIAVEGGGLLIGRAPAAAPGEHGMGLLALPDDGRSVSKTHLALLRSGNTLVAMDRASTNGSSLVRAGIERPLAAGEGVETADGDTIRFGDRSAEVMIGRVDTGEGKP
jgi:pSer/pThr/pTyr-binding forkhead associated (FHA) protein